MLARAAVAAASAGWSRLDGSTSTGTPRPAGSSRDGGVMARLWPFRKTGLAGCSCDRARHPPGQQSVVFATGYWWGYHTRADARPRPGPFSLQSCGSMAPNVARILLENRAQDRPRSSIIMDVLLPGLHHDNSTMRDKQEAEFWPQSKTFTSSCSGVRCR
jgi:hypothetical protein